MFDYVEEVVEEGVDEELVVKELDEKNVDGGGEGEEEVKIVEDGIIEFDEILINIISYN